MTTSSEHPDLFEQYKMAEKENEDAMKALIEYKKTHSLDSNAKKLSQHMEETSFKAARLKKQLDTLKIK